MANDIATTLIILLSFVATFTLARVLSRGWRKRRREKEEAARRANESRQVRRARERRQS
ncbi:MAG TPA: hypothetical protein VLK85_36650 [Ramlibacter sp.]|nr:hypothetical protein [Ramlibacter sp.]